MSNAAPTHCRVTKKRPTPPPPTVRVKLREAVAGFWTPRRTWHGRSRRPRQSAERTGFLRESGIRLLGEKFDPLRLGKLQFWWRVWDSNPRPVFVFHHLTGNGF